MDLGTFKRRFESLVQPPPNRTLISAEAAWGHFKAALRERIDGAESEEVGVSFGLSSHMDGKSVHVDPHLFQVYFGRLVDAETGASWRTAEIDFYFRFAMTPELENVIYGDVEAYVRHSDGEAAVHEKLQPIVAFANDHVETWNAIRFIEPALASYHFWVW